MRTAALVAIGGNICKVCTLWALMKVAATSLSTADYGLFFLARRILVFLPALTFLGVSNTMVRYVAAMRERDVERGNIVVANFLLVAMMQSAFLVASTIGQRPLATLYFGVNQTSSLYWSAVLMSVVFVFYFYLKGYCIGMMFVGWGTVLDIVLFTGWPLLAFFVIAGPSPEDILWFQLIGSGLLIGVGIACMLYRERHAFKQLCWVHLLSGIKIAVAFGMSRYFGNLLDTVLVVLGPWLLRASLHEVAYLTSAMIIIRSVEAGIGSLASFVSSATSNLIATRRLAEVNTAISLAVNLGIPIGLVASAFCFFFGAHIVLLLLGREYLEHAVYLQVISLSLLPLLLFQLLKGIIEAKYLFPHNSFNVGIGLVAFVVSYAVFRHVSSEGLAVALAYVVAYCVIATLSVWCVRRAISLGEILDWRNGSVACVSFLCLYFLSQRVTLLSGMVGLAQLAGIGTLVAAIHIMGLYGIGARNLMIIRRALSPRGLG